MLYSEADYSRAYYVGLQTRAVPPATVRRPHRSSRGRVQQCTPKVSLALRIVRAIVVRSLSNSSKLKSACGRVRLSLSGHSCWTPSCYAKKVLKHVKPCMRQAGVMTDQVDGWASSSRLGALASPRSPHPSHDGFTENGTWNSFINLYTTFKSDCV